MSVLHNSLGFTLLELLVTLILLSFLAALGARFLNHSGTSATLAKIDKMLEYAHFQAIRENRFIELSCDDIIEKLPHGEKVTCEFNLFPPKIRQILTFFPDGSSNGGQIIWHAQGQTNTLSIDWLTGEVSHVP